MKKTFLFTGVICAVFIVLCGTGWGGTEIPVPQPKGVTAATGGGELRPRDWTVMVYMDAKSDAGEEHLFGLVGGADRRDLAEMKKIGSNGRVNIVVEHGAKGKEVRRMLIVGRTLKSPNGELVYGRYPGADMGDYRRVADFVRWAKRNFPARKYMLVIWSHGAGWIDPRPQAISSSKGISFDEESGNYIRTRQMKEMMRGAGYVDILVHNACLMQMAEVLYEMKDQVGLFAGSEDMLSGAGFDYERLLAFLSAYPDFTAGQFGGEISASAGASGGGPDFPVTLSVVRGDALGELPGRLCAFHRAMTGNNEAYAARAAVKDVVRFSPGLPRDKMLEISPYADLYDLVRISAAKASSREAREAATELLRFVKERLVVSSVGFGGERTGYDYSRAGGISIHWPAKETAGAAAYWGRVLETRYSDLSLSRDSCWDEFISWAETGGRIK